jgi:hypothetical protein
MGERANQLQRVVASTLFRQATGKGFVRRMGAGAIKHVVIALPAAPPPTRPVFVIGCPRSGTTLLFDALARSSELASLGDEGHVLWEAFNHPSHHAWTSSALSPEDVTADERRWIYRIVRAVTGGLRFLEKTPRNCLRIPYVNELFPDATFVFLRRRAADNVNALIEGWRASPRYASYRLPEAMEGLRSLNGHHWSFVLLPGWRDLKHAPLEEICARQYVECNEAIVRARADLGPERCIDVAYESLVARPAEEVSRIYRKLGTTFSDAAAAFSASIPHTPINSLTPPRPDKWREQNPDEIRRILPLVAETERRLGY